MTRLSQIKYDIEAFKKTRYFKRSFLPSIPKWTKALRSGDFKQVKNRLSLPRADGDVGYCCLGVFKKVCPTNAASKGSTLSFLNGSVIPVSIQGYFAGLNDNSKKNFNYIADKIESIFL